MLGQLISRHRATCRSFHSQATLLARKQEATKLDPRTQLMRDVLFRNQTPAKLQFTEEEAIMHDTIHRAWQLHLRRQRVARDLDLERRYNRMRDACADLAEHDPKLFKMAMTRDPKARFPLNARALTETAPTAGWNHDWKRPQD